AGVLGPLILESQLSGEVPGRRGNRHPSASPRNIFPSEGHDRWVAIEIQGDDDWRRLLQVQGIPAELRAERFRTHQGRLQQEDEIENLLTRWTSNRTNREAALKLQTAGLCANPVQTAWDHAADAQLEARGFWRLAGHDRLGEDLIARLPFVMSGTPG